jgi:hypothetical protein
LKTLGSWIDPSYCKVQNSRRKCLIELSFFKFQLNGTGYSEGCMGSNGVKVWLFTGFVLGFAAMIAAVWLMVEEFHEKPEPGIALLLQNIMILLASLLYKFGRTDEAFGGGF